jgi:hypothetical protein
VLGRGEIKRGWESVHGERFRVMYFLLNVVRMVKSCKN